MTAKTPLDLIDAAIADLEAKLNLAPGQTLSTAVTTSTATSTATSTRTSTTSASVEEQTPTTPNIHNKKKSKQSTKHATNTTSKTDKNHPANNQEDLPDICKLEFKVGKIIKAWVHPDADKLYCEEIDVGEDTPRLIASGLRKHYTLDEMQGRRVVVVSNLKTKKLAGFASSGMVLCAAALDEKDGGSSGEKVEFVEPPEGAVIGEVITYQGLPPPQPVSGAQVEKKKIFPACAEGMKTTEEGLAAWNGHLFMTSGGPCTCATICNGAMR